MLLVISILLLGLLDPDIRSASAATYFSDVNRSDSFYTAVEYFANKGVISGYSDGTFRPGSYASRAQISKIIVNAKGWAPEPGSAQDFVDVPPYDPFYGYIEAIYHHGVISGYSCGSLGEPCPGLYFRPYNNTTRGQYMKMVVNAQAWSINSAGAPHFTDTAGTTFSDFIETGYNHILFTGYSDGTFRPTDNITRSAVCQILYAALALSRPLLHLGPYPGSNNRDYAAHLDLNPPGYLVSYYTDYDYFQRYRVLAQQLSWNSAATNWIYQQRGYGGVGIVFHAYGQASGQPCSQGYWSNVGANLPGFDPNYTVVTKPACVSPSISSEILLFMDTMAYPSSNTPKYHAYAEWLNEEPNMWGYLGKFNIDNYYLTVDPTGEPVYRDFMQNICYQKDSIYPCP